MSFLPPTLSRPEPGATDAPSAADGTDAPGIAGPPNDEAPRDGDVPRPFGLRHLLATGAVAAVVSAAVAVPVATSLSDDAVATAPAAPVTSSATANAPVVFDPGESLTAAIAAQVSPSVVRIDQRGLQGSALGSGVVYRSDGYILTNAHVIAGAREVRVTLPDGTEHDAEVVGADTTSDIAVLRIDATDLPTPAYADDLPDVGETALAIGSPYGLDGSVTAGIVSALNRRVNAGGNAPLIDLIQTDAAINSGNSGGALVNGSGEVIGINTAILSTTGGNDGIGFAIPVGTASRVADQLITSGVVRHAYLGIQARTVDPDVATLYGLATDEGVVVEDVVPGEAAATAGLQRGDIIVGFDGQPVSDMEDLLALLGELAPGDTVEVVWLRGQTERSARVTLGETTR